MGQRGKNSGNQKKQGKKWLVADNEGRHPLEERQEMGSCLTQWEDQQKKRGRSLQFKDGKMGGPYLRGTSVIV